MNRGDASPKLGSPKSWRPAGGWRNAASQVNSVPITKSLDDLDDVLRKRSTSVPGMPQSWSLNTGLETLGFAASDAELRPLAALTVVTDDGSEAVPVGDMGGQRTVAPLPPLGLRHVQSM
jgi:hypothetical protein